MGAADGTVPAGFGEGGFVDQAAGPGFGDRAGAGVDLVEDAAGEGGAAAGAGVELVVEQGRAYSSAADYFGKQGAGGVGGGEAAGGVDGRPG